MNIERVVELARAHERAGFSPGGTIAIGKHGTLIHQHSWGDVVYGPATPFRVASLTKSFTAQALQILRRSGSLQLDDPVMKHLEELRVDADPDWPVLRVRHLLAMSGGLATDNPWGDRQESISRGQLSDWAASGLRLLFPPGTSAEYSNLGYALLGEIITRLSGQNYREFVLEKILLPLELDSTRFSEAELKEAVSGQHRKPPLPGLAGGWQEQTPSGPGAFSAIGGLYSSVRDLLKWSSLFLKPALAAGQAFQPADLIEAQEPLGPATAALADKPLHGPVARGYGFGLAIENYENHGKVVGHSGGYPGFTAHMAWHQPSGLTVVTSTNGTHSAAPLLARRALNELIAEDNSKPEPVGPWAETREAVRTITGLASGHDIAEATDVFAMNVELDFPLAERLERLAMARMSLGEPGGQHGEPEFARGSSARWSLAFQFGELELYVELMPVAPFRVQTFVATMVQAGSRFRLF